MKQLLQNMKTGATAIKELPIPRPKAGAALVRTAFSLVSAGTERTLVEFAEKSLIEKAASRPDLVRQALDKAKREGLLTTAEAALNRLDQPMYPGYSSAGVIIDLGEGMSGFKVGDRVACGGGGHAMHAEYCVIPKNLLVHVPDDVDLDQAAFATLGSVAMHGFRLAKTQLNETVLVIGLGLLGMMAAQIAKAAGCRVLGLDISPQKVAMAREAFGVEACLRSDAELYGAAFTRNRGFDAALICAGSRDNDSIELAGQLCRDRGTVIALGAVGLNIPRKIYYEKEIAFLVSRSYGPGRYDLNYEEKGQDYPIGYVRWTEGRNMESFIDLLSAGKISVKKLISHIIPIEDGVRAYDLITGKTDEKYLGVLLSYPQGDAPEMKREAIWLEGGKKREIPAGVKLGVLGAGNYANATFLPALKHGDKDTEFYSIASGNGANARHAAEKFGFQKVDISGNAILDDPEVNTVALLTPHHLHADQVARALANEKHVYCEKPLALTVESLKIAARAVQAHPAPIFTIGYNRRFATLSQQLAQFFSEVQEPISMHYTVNAGYLPLNHWTQDPEIGGGRILGEGCHFIDYLIFLCRSLPVSVNAIALPDNGRYNEDNVSMQLRFENGSIGAISYLANGDKAYPKERVEVFGGGRIAILNDYRTLDTWENGNHKQVKSRLKQDKGHAASWAAFVDAIMGRAERPIPPEQLFSGALATIAAVESIRQKDIIALPDLSSFLAAEESA